MFANVIGISRRRAADEGKLRPPLRFRLTRLTNAFSKKRANLWAALGLYFAWCNFCRTHRTIRCTPAMEAQVTDHIWTIRELIGG